MNTKNNVRYKMSSERIETAFLSLLTKYHYDQITISDICKEADINRSTFYCHYSDINDLIIKIESKFAKGTANIFNYGIKRTNEAFVDLFTFVKNNKHFYKAFLNIPYITFAETNTKTEVLKNIGEKVNIKNNIAIFYRASFFGAGIKEICRLWLERDCAESPEWMAQLILDEYTNRSETN